MENEKEGVRWFGAFVGRVLTPAQFPFTAIREVKILKELSHENVVQLIEIVCDVGAPFAISQRSPRIYTSQMSRILPAEEPSIWYLSICSMILLGSWILPSANLSGKGTSSAT